MHIYANRPESDTDSQKEITKDLKVKNLKTSIIVHRGHSYHVSDTLKHMTKNAKIVFFGSCGSFGDYEKALDRAPGLISFISTKQTGVQAVNNPLLNQLNRAIMTQNEINWKKFWGRFQKGFKDQAVIKTLKHYVPPHQLKNNRFRLAYQKFLKSQKLQCTKAMVN